MKSPVWWSRREVHGDGKTSRARDRGRNLRLEPLEDRALGFQINELLPQWLQKVLLDLGHVLEELSPLLLLPRLEIQQGVRELGLDIPESALRRA